ncbi:MAG: CBS domain-containing protein [Mariprofundaceae bacterium]|nr:CBS domain-containing protein [Mariprofundaceae bacterium]
MLRGVLDLDDIEVGEIMTHRTDLEMIDADLSPMQIVSQVLSSQYTRLPLYRGDPDNVIGVLHAKALLREVQDHDRHIDEMDISVVATKPWFVPESTDCLSQLQAFRQRREHFALVIDEYGALQGVVSLEDIIEEIVGEIVDESDIPSLPEVWPQPDGSLVVAGTANLHDLNLALGTKMPEENVTTIGGLIVSLLGDQPEDKLCILESGVYIEVTSLHGDWIRRVKITKVADENGEPHGKSAS